MVIDLDRLQKIGESWLADTSPTSRDLGRLLYDAAAEIAELRGRVSGYEVFEEAERVAAEAAGKPMPTTNELENVLAFAAADTHWGNTTTVYSEACKACKTLAEEIEWLRGETND
jgi:hypothetical protein